ncbi:MAG TPA: TrbI/VirB10 family protein [Caulobacteraceae bacterium]|nr:TrbI/VirB10 family protein [Caulobacteraceae bacterium]
MAFLPPDGPLETSPRTPKVAPESVLAAPRLPVTRWNRRYLIGGAAVLAAIIAGAFWIGFGGAGTGPSKAASVKQDTDGPTAAPAFPDRYANGYSDPAVQGLARDPALPPPSNGLAGPAPSAASPPQTPVDPAVQQAREQAAAARASQPFFGGSGGQADGGQPGVAPGPVALVAPAAAPAPLAPDVQPANGQAGKRQFASDARLDDYLQNPERDPESPWEVKAGTVIPAALLTAVNSDLPGEIIAQVTEPVYDHVTGRTVLIPQGSRLIGQYDSQIAYGQERALIAWNRIVMPNGRSINIGAMEGADLTGASGLHDQVDGHFGQLARGIVLSTVFSIGASEAQDASARSSGSLVLNSAGSGVANDAEQVGSQITNRDLNRQPTIRIRAGWPLRVLVSKDMVLAPYP